MTRRRRIVLVGAGVLVALLGVAAWLLLRTPSEQPFWDYVTAMKARGEPTTFAEVLGPPPPDAENAWPEIDAALTEVEDESGREARWPKGVVIDDASPTTLSDTERAALSDFADGLGAFAGRVDAALDRAAFRFPLVVGRDDCRDFTHVDRAGDVVYLLDARARTARALGARLEACRTLARLAARMPNDDTSETRTAWRALRRCVRALRDDAAADAVDPKALRARMDGALTQSWLPRVASTLRYRRVMWIVWYRAMLEGRLPSDRQRLGLTMDVWVRLKSARDRLAGRRIDLPLERGMAEEIVAQCEMDADASKLDTTSYVRFEHGQSALAKARGFEGINTTFLHYAGSLAWADARARLARVALALGAFRAEHGEFPAALDELRGEFGGDVPTDPTTDAPFVYERTPSGVRVSSRGRTPECAALTPDEAASLVLAWELKL